MTRRTGWMLWARRALVIALVGFAIAAVVFKWSDITAALRQLDPWAPAVALIPGFGGMFIALFVWRTLMTDLGHPLPVPAAARIFYISQLGKYVPGSVWSILTQIELSREHNIPKRTNVTVGVLAIAVTIATGLSLAAVMLAFTGGDTLRHYWWILLLIPAFLGALHPRVLGPGLNFALRLIRREPLPRTPSWPGMLKVAALQLGIWLCLGLQAWLLLLGLGAPAWESLPIAIGGYALAYSLGSMAIIFPAGAGVREAALALALATVVPAAQAAVVAILCRAILTVVDLSNAGAQYLVLRRSKTPA